MAKKKAQTSGNKHNRHVEKGRKKGNPGVFHGPQLGFLSAMLNNTVRLPGRRMKCGGFGQRYCLDIGRNFRSTYQKSPNGSAVSGLQYARKSNSVWAVTSGNKSATGPIDVSAKDDMNLVDSELLEEREKLLKTIRDEGVKVS